MATTVEEWLNSIGLGKYAEVFAANDVDLRALPHLDAADLQELGVSLGHRKIILNEIAALRGLRAAGNRDPGTGPARARRRSAARASRPTRSAREAPTSGCSASYSATWSLPRSCRVDSSAEEMHDLISAYQNAVATAVTRFGGYVAKFLGDGVLVYFGWPMAYEDHAERAIRAGLAAINAVAQLKTAAGEPLEARVGIATGRVVVGDLAGGGVLDRGQVAGDTPNLAARLQTVADPGQVVIADVTRRLAGQAFEFEALGTRELKGFRTVWPSSWCAAKARSKAASMRPAATPFRGSSAGAASSACCSSAGSSPKGAGAKRYL